jgi:maltokinase
MTDGRLIDFATAQRWFASKTRNVIHAEVLDRAVLRESDPALALELVEFRFDTGTHEIYQLLAEGPGDVPGDPSHLGELVRLMRSGARVSAGQGVVAFASAAGLAGAAGELRAARAVDAEQSNTSLVFDDALILKVYRRLSPGVNPELEVLRFLTERGFPNIAPLVGWYEYLGSPIDATLGVLQPFVAGAVDGWELALKTMRDGRGGVIPRLRRLGEVTGRLHSVLGSDQGDPGFRPEETSAEALPLLTATVDEEIERMFSELPEENRALDPIRGRGEEVRERLRLLTHVAGAGRVIRTHGDFHLGQALWADGDWVVIDFEGEPARPLSERRRKRSPLRDVAGMLRSFAYAASAAPLLEGVDPPDGWEEQARFEFLSGYDASVDRSLMPAGASTGRLLAVFELEKAVYELRYELDNRPAWIGIPVAGIARMLEEDVPG